MTGIKQMSRNIGKHMEEEKKVTDGLDAGFGKSKELVSNLVKSMDTMMNQNGGSICCYVALFTFIMVAFLVYLV